MQIYNTLTRKKEEFIPISLGKVSMYVCGPTVYDYIHIGNARPLVIFDTLHRYLKYMGYDVTYVVNFTDIDDKIINRAIDEGVPFDEISERYIEAFLDQAQQLNLLESETIHPRATDSISEMITFIQGLVDKGAAYDAEDAVYFDVSKAEDYGKLSKKNIEDLQAGARIRVNEMKKSPMDFALWKKKKEDNEPSWDSPWGEGRPGWHIECSTMAKNILGDTIDIHGGGEDLQFPHHENEIAQSETLHDHSFAHYWMHNSMITVTSDTGAHEKMSKSKGNFWTLKDIAEDYDLILVRMWLLSSHYRSPINFSQEVIEQTQNGYQRIINGKANLERLLSFAEDKEMTDKEKVTLEDLDLYRRAFIKAMDDDLNTADALTAVYELIKLANSDIDEASSMAIVEKTYQQLNELLDVLGIADRRQKEILAEDIEKLIEERTQARVNKDFQRADEIRDYLKEEGIILKDTSTGVVWERE